MHCRRIAVAAAVIALPFALTACSSSGTSGAGSGPLGALGQKTVQLNPSSPAGTPKGAPTPTSQDTAGTPDSGATTSGSDSGTTTSGSDSNPTSASDTHSYVASSAFCADVAKATDDSSKMDAGDTSVTNAITVKDVDTALADAPGPVKADMQIIDNAVHADAANGKPADPASTQSDNPQADAAAERLLTWASANCKFQQ
ncbi:hypothetical protein [Catenulispora rubra]|uniref:hypothetical protein n=1 Tax=Catenulispora rubra TaxID=280293 RepID=UPI0018926BDD|nr:hypothetical protein [Catenulispora rubra]